jgi:nicotinamide mononucleotide (NMN) deamidase PncC
MAGAARRLFSTEVGIGVTGVAGPSGQEGKPPGLVYLAVSAGDREVRRELHFNGGRGANRLAAVEAAVDLAIEALDGK